MLNVLVSWGSGEWEIRLGMLNNLDGPVVDVSCQSTKQEQACSAIVRMFVRMLLAANCIAFGACNTQTPEANVLSFCSRVGCKAPSKNVRLPVLPIAACCYHVYRCMATSSTDTHQKCRGKMILMGAC
jgi:hypothetical protein